MRRNPAELLLLNPAATRALTVQEVGQVMRDLDVPKAWRTRFMQGMEIEWREHGGGIDAHGVGSLVKDHLSEDPNYYSPQGAPPMMRHNPRKPSKVQSVIIPKDRFTKRQAQSWIAQHGFVDPGVDETDDYYRFRQMDPDRQHFKYRTIPFGDSGVQAVVRVSRLPQMRSNPDGFDAAVDAIRAAPSDQKALQLAYPMALQLAHHLGVPVSTARGTKAMLETAQSVAQAVRSGAVAGAGASVATMPEVAQALEGTGLVPVALEQATQIAEVQTSQGVVDVPVAAVSEADYAAIENRIYAAKSWKEAFAVASSVPLAVLRAMYDDEVTPQRIADEQFPDGDEDEDEDRYAELSEDADNLVEAFQNFDDMLRQADDKVYNEWAIGGKQVTSEYVSMYPSAEAAVEKAKERGLEKYRARFPDEEPSDEDEVDFLMDGISPEELDQALLSMDKAMYSFDYQLRTTDSFVYERWKAGGKEVSGDYMSMYPAVEEAVEEVRKRAAERGRRNNPEWARKLGQAAYKGTRRAAQYAAEVGTDLYHGAKSAQREYQTRRAASAGALSAGMPSTLVAKVEDLAGQNLYMDAVALVAKALGDKGAAKHAKNLDAEQDKIGHLTPALREQQEALAKSVFASAQAMWGADAAHALHGAYVGAM